MTDSKEKQMENTMQQNPGELMILPLIKASNQMHLPLQVQELLPSAVRSKGLEAVRTGTALTRKYQVSFSL